MIDTIPDAHRTVRLTARASALLFATSQATAALDPPGRRRSRTLYLAFVTAHAAHFVAVTRYAVLTGGRQLFPGGRGLQDVGGWPTMFAIYGAFTALALAGLPPRGPGQPSDRPRDGLRSESLNRVASGLTGAMFAGTYLGQVRRSPAAAVLAGLVAAPTVAHVVRGEHPAARGRRATPR